MSANTAVYVGTNTTRFRSAQTGPNVTVCAWHLVTAIPVTSGLVLTHRTDERLPGDSSAAGLQVHARVRVHAHEANPFPMRGPRAWRPYQRIVSASPPLDRSKVPSSSAMVTTKGH